MVRLRSNQLLLDQPCDLSFRLTDGQLRGGLDGQEQLTLAVGYLGARRVVRTADCDAGLGVLGYLG